MICETVGGGGKGGKGGGGREGLIPADVSYFQFLHVIIFIALHINDPLL